MAVHSRQTSATVALSIFEIGGVAPYITRPSPGSGKMLFHPGGGGDCQNSASPWAGFPDVDQESRENYKTGQKFDRKLSSDSLGRSTVTRKMNLGSLQVSADHIEPPEVTLLGSQNSAA